MTFNRARILEFAARNKLPLVSGWGPWAKAVPSPSRERSLAAKALGLTIPLSLLQRADPSH